MVNREIQGFSLFSYANGASKYKEVPDTSDVHPLFISFVEYPANQVLFEVLDRDMYISKMEAVKMADEDKSLLDKLKDLLNSYDEEVSKSDDKETEETVKEEVVEEKEIAKTENSEEEVKEEKPAEGEKVETQEKSDEEPLDDEIKKEETPVTETGTTVKEEEVSNADVLEAIIQLTKIIKEYQTNAVVEEETVKEEPETYIIKQATSKVDKKVNKENKNEKQYFDILGRKI